MDAEYSGRDARSKDDVLPDIPCRSYVWHIRTLPRGPICRSGRKSIDDVLLRTLLMMGQVGGVNMLVKCYSFR
jgi:hypothetical protein